MYLQINGRYFAAAPHQRGWTHGWAASVAGAAGCPAPAGMDPRREIHSSGVTRLPRTSGDGPLQARIERHLKEAAPHQRGWTRSQKRASKSSGGCPAPAGMDPRWLAWPMRRMGLPRTSGDGPRAARR